MTRDTTRTRRTFLKGSALLAAPLAAASVSAAALADEELQAHVRCLENEAAIRDLHQAYLRQVNAGERGALLDRTVRRIVADHAGAPDRIEIAADGQSAVGYFECTVVAETLLATDCTLAQMAHAQGGGSIVHTERRLLTAGYTKASGAWKIARLTLTRL